MDTIAAHLNELGMQQSSINNGASNQPEAPPRNNRNNSRTQVSKMLMVCKQLGIEIDRFKISR